MSDEMTSNRPYLLRALYEWIKDNNLTPYILVDAQFEGVSVPPQAVQNGKVILNIAPSAVQDLEIANDWLIFDAKFSGVNHQIDVPMDAVIAIYARENGQGMMFAQDDETPPPSSPDDDPKPEKSSEKSHLKLVK